MTRKLLASAFFMAALGLLGTSNTAWAIWAPVPLEVLIDESHLIVVGKVSKVVDAGFAVGNRNMDAAVVEVKQILKALPLAGKPTTVRIGQPAAGGIAISIDIRFQAGTEGIWLLKKDPQQDIYWAKHPSQFQPLDQLKTLSTMVKSREKITGGTPVQGLVARVEAIAIPQAQGKPTVEVRCSVQNVSEKPITLCTFIGNAPVQLNWIGPDGKPLPSRHNDWLQRVRLQAPSKFDFPTIEPGAIHFIGDAITFTSQNVDDERANISRPGEQTVTATFQNSTDGKAQEIPHVWTGKVISGSLKFKVE